MLIVGFCVGDLICFGDEYSELIGSLSKVQSFDDLKAWTLECEDVASECVMGQIRFIETYGYIQKLQGKREFNNFSYIKDDDGMLYYGSVMELEIDDLDEYARNVMRLNEYVESRGAHLLVLIPPTKVLYGVTNLDKNWTVNDPNTRTDKLLSLLSQYGVNSLDLRYYMENTDLSLEELFFKTDHHWTPLAAFYATRAVIERMNDDYNLDLDPDKYYRTLDNYNSYTYTDCFLGSTGENAGAVYSGVDDYTFYWPKCDMKFRWIDHEHHEEEKGSFEEALLYENRLDDGADIYAASMGSIYIREIVDSDSIINESNESAPKLMVLRDSYFSPIATFLAPMFSKIDMLWTRNESGIKMEDYVKDGDYDYLILEVYPYNLDSTSFDFFTD